MTEAVLFIDRPQFVLEKIAGLTVIERQLFTARRAGIRRIWINQPRPNPPAPLRLPEGLELIWSTPIQDAEKLCRQAHLILSGNHFLRCDILRSIASGDQTGPVSFLDDSGRSVVQALPFTSNQPQSPKNKILPAGTAFSIDNGCAKKAVDWLLIAGTKAQDGFMARHFDRRISLTISRLLLDTRITPNIMTVFSSILGLIGAAFFLGSTRWFYAAGALLIWLHSVLDGCDGELARLRFQESALGAALDFWCDNLVHLALFSCLGLGFWRTGNGYHTLVLAGIADIGVLASAWMAWQYRVARRAEGGTEHEAAIADEPAGGGFESKLGRLENALAQRDFIYVLVLLAFAGDVYEFLWAAAIGVSLFLAVMLYLRRINEHEQARQAHFAR